MAKRGDFYGDDDEPYERADDEPLPDAGYDPKTGKRKCEACGKGAVRKNGPYGEFWGCSTYPRCNWKETISAKASRKPEPADREGAVKGLSAAFDFIEACGGAEQAKMWLGVAQRVLSTGKASE